MRVSALILLICMLTTGIFAAPAPPTNVAASDGTYTDKVRVTWKAPIGATSYEVWRGTSSSSSSASKKASPTATTYDDTSATAGTTYYYWIKAKNATGTSGFSASNTGYRAVPPPVPPSTLAASDGTYADKVRITWTSPGGATGYEVWRGTSSSSSSASKIASPTSTSYDDTAATAGTTYYYWAKAKNTGGTSGFSNSDTGYRVSVVFNESGTKYGYDGYTDSKHPWKSLETGLSDTVRAVTAPSSAYKSVSLTSSSSSAISVSPAAPTSASQIVTNQAGDSRTTAQINARVNDSNFAYYKAAAYRKVQKTVAVILVNESDTDGSGPNKGYTSTNISDASITSELQKVYKQAIIEWTVVRRSTCTVDFDLNNDVKLDVSVWMTPEMQKIRDACGSSTHAYNIFLVNKPSVNGRAGSMMFNQKYGFVHADWGNANTVAHELGHGAGGLTHTTPDSDNIMYDFEATTRLRLRKNQWDQLNP